MKTQEDRDRFELLVMPHLDAAYNFARWLTRNVHDAEDVTQEAFVRAMTFFPGFHGCEAKPWLLAIVRNTYLTRLRRAKQHASETLNDEMHESGESALDMSSASELDNPEMALVRKASAQLVNRALRRVPPDAREVLILRELEDLSYKEIAHIVSAPIGTVMSRLHRGRRLLREELQRLDEELLR